MMNKERLTREDLWFTHPSKNYGDNNFINSYKQYFV